MNYPVFIFHELVLRVSYVNSGVGRYFSSTVEKGECLIRTTTGKIRISLGLLERQYYDPHQISQEELQQLAAGFQFETN